MELIKDMEAFMHLFAQALARARGDEQPHIFADVVVGHARDIAKRDDETNNISTSVAKSDEQMLAATPAAEIEKDKDSTVPATSARVDSTSPSEADVLAVQTQNQHQNALPDSAKTSEQLAAEQEAVDKQRSDLENDHDQTIQQIHGEESARAAAEERATMEANAQIAEPADKGLYYNAATKVVFVSGDDQPDSNVRPIKAADVADLVKDGATVDASAQAYAPNEDEHHDDQQ